MDKNTLEIPCKPGDTVFAFIDDLRVKTRNKFDLDECIVSEISWSKDYPEPLFTVICYEKADYNRFWLHEFGEAIFTPEQFYALPENWKVKR